VTAPLAIFPGLDGVLVKLCGSHGTVLDVPGPDPRSGPGATTGEDAEMRLRGSVDALALVNRPSSRLNLLACWAATHDQPETAHAMDGT